MNRTLDEGFSEVLSLFFPFCDRRTFLTRCTEQGTVLSRPSVTSDCYRYVHQRCYPPRLGEAGRRHSEKENEKYFQETVASGSTRNFEARIFQSSLEDGAGMVFSSASGRKKKSDGFKAVRSPRWGYGTVLWKVACFGSFLPWNEGGVLVAQESCLGREDARMERRKIFLETCSGFTKYYATMEI